MALDRLFALGLAVDVGAGGLAATLKTNPSRFAGLKNVHSANFPLSTAFTSLFYFG